jgi:MFS transporter, ACS family, aldohexuronate transporter
VVAAGALLALSQAGGTIGRLGWGIVSDRLFGGRRRPGLVISAALGASMSLVFASGVSLPAPVAGLVAFLVGIGGFGWVGLYLALAAEVGGSRYASLITGVAVSYRGAEFSSALQSSERSWKRRARIAGRGSR